MESLSPSASYSSLHSPLQPSTTLAPPSPSPSRSISSASASPVSSRASLHSGEEDHTIKARPLVQGNSKSSDNLELLAISSRITELSYAISDIETRLFGIQELRHKSQSGDDSEASRDIDQSLAALNERLASVSKGVKSVTDSLDPVLQSLKTPTLAQTGERDEDATIIRKHAVMLSEWESVQKESETLREELKEDKWLTVFRTVTEQADGMMSSVEKAINRCHDFIHRIRKHGPDTAASRASSVSSLNSSETSSHPLTLEYFKRLQESYEAKKKHYVPATTKVLSIIDKGVQDRVTKNGECLRRHAESTQRWQHLQDRMRRTDREMEEVGKMFTMDLSPSEAGSSVSGTTASRMHRNNNLLTPPSNAQSPRHLGLTLSRSISPFRKLARKFKHSPKSPTLDTPPVPRMESRTPSSEPPRGLKHRSSLFNMMTGHALPLTPERPSHKHAQSLTPDTSPAAVHKAETTLSATLKGHRPAWNSSTKVHDENPPSRTGRSGSRRPSNAQPFRISEDCSPNSSTPSTPYRRSVSRSSMASSRPWSPVTSSVSTAQSSSNPLASLYRPPSRAQTVGLPTSTSMTSPRTRPKTPSGIPAPPKHFRSISVSQPASPIAQRMFATVRSQTPSGIPPRPPSRSMIPIPSVQVSGSRPSSAMSNYGRPDSAMSFRSSAIRARTPDALRMTPRPSILRPPRLPPSSFKDTSAPHTPISRPSSRAGAATPSFDRDGPGPVHVYTPASTKDPLDAEFAAVVNSVPHALLIERLDPPLRKAPKEGEEIRAQYAFCTQLSRKVVTCKLTTLARSGRDHPTKRVMCRVGGGWQDLRVYITSSGRQSIL